MSPNRVCGVLSIISLAALLRCGASEEPAGFSASNDAAVDVQQPVDASFGWPDADPDPEAGPGPSPGFDAGVDSGPPPTTCNGKTQGAGSSTLSLQSSGRTRTAILHVPASYDPTKGTMLVLNFHGFGSASWQQALLTRMSAESDARGFIVAYPEGIVTSWNAGDCCGTAWTDSVDDVRFARDLLDALEERYCIDPRRVFATGMSNGGFFAHRLACELSDRIAAIAPVAGVLGMNSCAPPRSVPVLHFHGTADPIVPYGGGTPLVPQLGLGLNFKSVADTLEHWRKHNGCSAFEKQIYQKGDATCVEWPDCNGAASTVLCSIEGGGHTWPGGLAIPAGKTSQDLGATATMLDFFDAHPMP
ncbi:MAG: PHB depolymerase family esterase [Polyangiaceae bacterium]